MGTATNSSSSWIRSHKNMLYNFHTMLKMSFVHKINQRCLKHPMLDNIQQPGGCKGHFLFQYNTLYPQNPRLNRHSSPFLQQNLSMVVQSPSIFNNLLPDNFTVIFYLLLIQNRVTLEIIQNQAKLSIDFLWLGFCVYIAIYGLRNWRIIANVRGIHGSKNYCPVRFLFFKRELRMPDHYLRLLSELYINI